MIDLLEALSGASSSCFEDAFQGPASLAERVLLLQALEDGRHLETIHHELKERTRIKVDRAATPSAAVIDSRSVRSSEQGGEGYEGHKKPNGREHHTLVDTTNLVLAVEVLPANMDDRKGGEALVRNPIPESAPVTAV